MLYPIELGVLASGWVTCPPEVGRRRRKLFGHAALIVALLHADTMLTSSMPELDDRQERFLLALVAASAPGTGSPFANPKDVGRQLGLSGQATEDIVCVLIQYGLMERPVTEIGGRRRSIMMPVLTGLGRETARQIEDRNDLRDLAATKLLKPMSFTRDERKLLAVLTKSYIDEVGYVAVGAVRRAAIELGWASEKANETFAGLVEANAILVAPNGCHIIIQEAQNAGVTELAKQRRWERYLGWFVKLVAFVEQRWKAITAIGILSIAARNWWPDRVATPTSQPSVIAVTTPQATTAPARKASVP